MTLQFAIFYSFSVMLAVVTRNTVACAFGTLLFFAACIVMNTARHSLVLHVGEPGYLTTMPAWWLLTSRRARAMSQEVRAGLSKNGSPR